MTLPPNQFAAAAQYPQPVANFRYILPATQAPTHQAPSAPANQTRTGYQPAPQPPPTGNEQLLYAVSQADIGQVFEYETLNTPPAHTLAASQEGATATITTVATATTTAAGPVAGPAPRAEPRGKPSHLFHISDDSEDEGRGESSPRRRRRLDRAGDAPRRRVVSFRWTAPRQECTVVFNIVGRADADPQQPLDCGEIFLLDPSKAIQFLERQRL